MDAGVATTFQPRSLASGGKYQWRAGLAPTDLAPAPPPPWLVDLLTEERSDARTRNGAGRKAPSASGLGRLIGGATRYVASVPGVESEGRNDAAFGLAGRRTGLLKSESRCNLSA